MLPQAQCVDGSQYTYTWILVYRSVKLTFILTKKFRVTKLFSWHLLVTLRFRKFCLQYFFFDDRSRKIKDTKSGLWQIWAANILTYIYNIVITGKIFFLNWSNKKCHNIFVYRFKGTVPHDFWLQVFHESISPKPLSIPFGRFQIFPKICRDTCRWTTSIIDTGGKLEKSLVRKVLNVLFGHLCVVKSTYRWNFFLSSL